MKFLLAAVNAKYIHSNLGVYSLKKYAEEKLKAARLERSGQEEQAGWKMQAEQEEQAGQKMQAEREAQADRKMQAEREEQAGQKIAKEREAQAGREMPGRGKFPGSFPAPEWEIEIGEYTINQQTDAILRDIYGKAPDAVGFSCYIWNILQVRELVRDLKKVLPDTEIWLGGPEVSYRAEEILSEEPGVRGVMAGEGEETFFRLLESARERGKGKRHSGSRTGTGLWSSEALSRIPGLVFRLEPESKPACARQAGAPPTHESPAGARGIPELMPPFGGGNFQSKSGGENGEGGREEIPGREENMSREGSSGAEPGVVRTPPAPLLSLDSLPFAYGDLSGLEHRIIYYESSRGCPFSCSYCLSSIDKSVRFRDLELVKRELLFFLDRKVPQVKFVDRTFNCKRSHSTAVWQFIKEHDNGVTNFHFEISADLLSEEELSILSGMRPGLVQLEIGVQTTNPDAIREIRRSMDLERLRENVRRINGFGNIHQHLDLIAGLPFEGYESFRASFNDVYRMEPEQLQLGFLKVLSGSYMMDMREAYGLRFRSGPPYEVLMTKWLSYGEVLRLKYVEEMVEVYYNSGQFRNTVQALAGEFPSPFDMFEALAGYYEEKGLFSVSHSRMARYEILFSFIRGRIGEGERLEEYRDLLAVDLYLRENVKNRPSFLRDPSPYRERVKQFFADERKNPKYLPAGGRDGRTSGQIGKTAHIEVMRDGSMVLFDYLSRDAFFGNAAAKVVGNAGEENE